MYIQEIEDGNAQDFYDHASHSRSGQHNNDSVSWSNSKSNFNGATQGCSPSTFQLLKVRGLQNWANAGCVGIRDVIEVSIFSSYFAPFCFLLAYYSHIGTFCSKA